MTQEKEKEDNTRVPGSFSRTHNPCLPPHTPHIHTPPYTQSLSLYRISTLWYMSPNGNILAQHDPVLPVKHGIWEQADETFPTPFRGPRAWPRPLYRAYIRWINLGPGGWPIPRPLFNGYWVHIRKFFCSTKQTFSDFISFVWG